MEFKKLEKKHNSEINFKDTLALIESNRIRVRALCSMILTSCSIFLSTSFVVLLFVIHEKYVDSLSIVLPLIISDTSLIIAIFFCLFSAYLKEPKSITTQFALISQQAYYYIREQKNSRISIIFLFIGIFNFMIGLLLFGLKLIY